MADKNAYWQERRAQMMYEQMEIAENASNIIGKEYHKVAKYIEHQLSNNFEKAAKKFKVSDKDVLAIIKEAGVTSYQDIVRVAKNKGLTELVEYLEQPGRKYKFERLVEKLENVQNAVDSLKKAEELHTTEALKEVAESTYYKSIYEVQSHTGLGFSFNEWDDKLFEKLVTSKWSGKNYSSRIWANGDKLAETLKSEIIQGYVAGKTQDEMYKVIMDEFSTSAFNARRLVRTESCYVANEMEMQSYAECDIDRYIFIATLDLRTSELCASHDGKVYYVKDAVPGVNMPPMHPFCRSTTIEYLDEDTLKRMRRRARDPVTGKNEIVPAGMTYKDWYAKYVEGNPEVELPKKKDDVSKYLSYKDKYNKNLKKLDTMEKANEELFDKYNKAIGTSEEKKLEKRFNEDYDRLGRFKESVKDVKAKLSGKEAKAVRQVEKQLADKMGVDVSNVNMTGMPYDSADMVLKSYETVLNKYPELKENLTRFTYENVQAEAYAACTTLTGHIKAKGWFGDFDKLVEKYANDVAKKYHPLGTDHNSIIVHELGHALDGLMTKKGMFGGKVTPYGEIRSSYEVQNLVLDKLGWFDEMKQIKESMTVEGASLQDIDVEIRKQKEAFITKHISKYACENPSEFFAECFAEYVMSDTPREASKIFGDIINNELGR